MQFLIQDQNAVFFQLFFAVMLGMVIGVERVIAHKTAGLRTYALVSMSSCLFIILAQMIGLAHAATVEFQIMQVPAAIITGIGFLGAGIIIFQNHQLSGLTTAASLWVACGIGMAIGYKLYAIAFFVTILTLFVFTILWFVEDGLKRWSAKHFKEGETQR